MINNSNWFRLGRKQLSLCFLLFLGLNIAIYSFSPADSFIMQDTHSYLEPAQQLISEGIYRSEIRQPGYPFMLAGLLLLTDNLGLMTVLVQIVMAFATGLLAGLLAEKIHKNSGLFTLLFTCFNPVTLLYVQSISSDLPFAFLFIAHLFFLVKMLDKLSFGSAVATGLLAGLAAVMRGNGQFLIVVFPLLLILAYRINKQQFVSKKLVLAISISLMSALIIITPWLHFNYKNGNGLSFSSTFYQNYVIHENVIAAVVKCKKSTLGEAKQLVYDKFDHPYSPVYIWNSEGKKRLYANMAQNPFKLISEVCGLQVAPGMIKTMAIFFLSSSGRSWAQIWQLNLKQRFQANLTETFSQFSFTAVLRGDPNVSRTSIFWHVFSLGFVILVRIFNLLGLIFIVRKKQWYLLIPLLIYTLIFAGTAGFIGYSRFRLPLDPLLAILASLGVVEMLSRIHQCSH